MEDIAERVRKIVADQLGQPIEDVKLESRFVKDLGADSLDTIEIVMALEEAFSFEISDEESEQMQKISDVVKYLQKHLPDPESK
jgi:acyl carrier protein